MILPWRLALAFELAPAWLCVLLALEGWLALLLAWLMLRR